MRDKSLSSRFLFTGGPGVGKTTTIAHLQALGYTCVPEVARKIIRSRIENGLEPRPSPAEFARLILDADEKQYDHYANSKELVFFDRGIPDALGMMFECGAIHLDEAKAQLPFRPYNRTAFYFPPWEEIYETDKERDQSYEDCARVSANIKEWFEVLGFSLVEVPRLSPQKRCEFILNQVRQIMPGA